MFEKVEELFFPLENILRKKLYNLYKDRDIDELKQIIVEVEIKNVYLMKEIENLKNINMRLEQELIDEKNNKAFKNLFNERKKKENKFGLIDTNIGDSNLKISNENFVKKELDINIDEGKDLELYDMMLNAELNEKAFEELKLGIPIPEKMSFNQFEKKDLNKQINNNIKVSNRNGNNNKNNQTNKNIDYTSNNSKNIQIKKNENNNINNQEKIKK